MPHPTALTRTLVLLATVVALITTTLPAVALPAPASSAPPCSRPSASGVVTPTDCLALNPEDYKSGCGDFSAPTTVYPGDELTITVTFTSGGMCGGGPALSVSWADPEGMTVDGQDVTAGAMGRSYRGLGPIQADPDAGVSVPLADFAQEGSSTHTVTVKIRDDAPMGCVHELAGEASGPWMLLTGDGGTSGWSTNKPFQIMGDDTLTVTIKKSTATVTVSPKMRRTIVLQEEVSGAWVSVRSTKTSARTGRGKLKKLKMGRKYRVYAPAAKGQPEATTPYFFG